MPNDAANAAELKSVRNQLVHQRCKRKEAEEEIATGQSDWSAAKTVLVRKPVG